MTSVSRCEPVLLGLELLSQYCLLEMLSLVFCFVFSSAHICFFHICMMELRGLTYRVPKVTLPSYAITVN